jgi:arsenate reductase (thioredoxin)
VCVENTFRSVLSEELFNSKAPPGWRAESAGVNPASAVNPVVKGLLDEVGITLTERKPKVVTPEMVTRADHVVTFGCLDRCPIGTEGKAEDWPIPGSTGKSSEELRSIRDELSKRVEGLIKRYCIPFGADPNSASALPPTMGLRELRNALVEAARARGTLSYGQLMKIMGVSRGKPLFDAIVAVDKEEYAIGAPGFAAIIVRKDTGFPGGGFFCDQNLPLPLRRPYSRASDPKLSAAEMNYVKGAQRKIWDYYKSHS